MKERLAVQRLKLLYLAKFLNEESNEEHPVSIEDMINYLDGYSISAERKALYNDIEALQDFGMDILTTGGRKTRYYVASRDFELAELKLLADVVESSNFVTEKKSKQLIDKIEKLTDKYDAKGINHQVMVSDRAKTGNEAIFYSVDRIWNAIDNNRTIRFKYYHYDMHKKKINDHDGATREVSPFILLYEMKNYYMLAYDENKDQLWHYRVDRMLNVEVTDNPRKKADRYTKEDFRGYVKGVFNMYHGPETDVTLEMPDGYANVIIDRFGIDTIIIPVSPDRFRVTVPVQVSKQFYGWVFGLGSQIKIISPQNVIDEYVQICKETLEIHN